MTVRIDNSGVDKFGEAFPVIFAILVILMLVVIAANFILRTKDDSKEAIKSKNFREAVKCRSRMVYRGM